MAKFLPAQLYNSIFTGTQWVAVAAKRNKLTVFFSSDIANFTETTDSLESEELTNLLNRYLTEMSKIAVTYGATIDKYIGDAIMGFSVIRRAGGARRTPCLRQDGNCDAATDAPAAAQVVGSGIRTAVPAAHRDQHGLLHCTS